MWRRVVGCLVVCGWMGAAAWGQTAGELVARNIQARGGAKLRSLTTIRMSGKLTVAGTEGGPFLLEIAPASHRVRLETTDKEKTDVRVFDGSSGWALTRSDGNDKATRLSGDALKELKGMGDFQGGLFDYEAKGNQVEFLGKDDIAGTPVYTLKLTERDGEETTIYLDAKTFLEVREESTHGGRGDTVQSTTLLTDYKQVDGLTVPFTITAKQQEEMGGGSIRMDGSLVIALDKVEVNVDLPASRFAKP